MKTICIHPSFHMVIVHETLRPFLPHAEECGVCGKRWAQQGAAAQERRRLILGEEVIAMLENTP